VLDFSKGYPPRNTFWNWASFVGRTEDGRSFGLNLTADFNNALENAMWVNGRLVPLATALFRYQPTAVLDEWRLTTADGVIDLRFIPDGLREENITLGAFESRFQQPFGRFEGTVKLQGQTVHVTGSGVTEQHWATW
jgi:predicted secreted hydrolase